MVFGCFAWAAERLVFGVEVRFARSSFIFLYAVLAGLGSCLGGVWLFRMGCRGLVFGVEVRFARSRFIFL